MEELQLRVAWLENVVIELLRNQQRTARSSARRYKNLAEGEERFAVFCDDMFTTIPTSVQAKKP